MNFDILAQFFHEDYWINIVNTLQFYGPIIAIGLPIIEAFFPPIPLTAFVTVNVMAFGFWQGFLFSWIGNCLGSITLFLLLKKIGQKRFEKFVKRSDKFHKIYNWIRNKGYSAVFLLLCFPFTPSFLVCSISALSGMNTYRYILSSTIARGVSITILSLIGYNIASIFTKPIQSIVILIIIGVTFFVSKYIFDKKLLVS